MRRATCVLVLLALTGPAAAQDQRGNLVTVTVEGLGTSREEALADGKRKAVEQAAGTYLYSQSQTRDFVLIRDSVLARSAGFVQSVETLSETRRHGIIVLQLRCVVSRQGIEDTWGVVKNLLQQMGKPKVLVLIDEKVDEVTGTVHAGRAVAQDSVKQVVQDGSTVRGRIENLLLGSGFDLVSREQLEQISARDLAAARAEDDPARAQALAKRFGAQLFIKGTAHATVGLPATVYGVLLYTYEGQCNIRCYNTDNAKLLASQTTPLPAPRGTGRTWRSGADMALTSLGDLVAPAVRQDILRAWLDATTMGQEITLELAPVTLRQLLALRTVLEAVEGVESVVPGELANGVATVKIHTVHSAAILAEKLLDIDLSGQTLDVTDLSANVIRAKVAPSP